MKEMEDASNMAARAIQAAESFLFKENSKKIGLSPTEKLPNSAKVKDEQLSDKPLTIKKEVAAFLKGPMRFMLGATALTVGTVGFVTLLPLGLIGAGIGVIVGALLKKGLKEQDFTNSDRLGAAAGATIGSFGAPLLVAAGLKLMAESSVKKEKPELSKEEAKAKEIVENAINKTTSSLSKPTAKQIVDSLTDLIEEDLKENPANAPSAIAISRELQNKIGLLSQEQEVNNLYNNWVDGKKTNWVDGKKTESSEEPKKYLGSARLKSLDKSIEKILEAPIPTKTPEQHSKSHENPIIGNKDHNPLVYVDQELGEFHLNTREDQLDKHMFKPADASYERLPTTFFLPKDTSPPIENTVNYSKPSKELVEGFRGAYLDFLKLGLKDNPHFHGALSEKEAKAQLMGHPNLAIIYYDEEKNEMMVAHFNKKRVFEANPIEEKNLKEVQRTTERLGYKFIDKLPQVEKGEKDPATMSFTERNLKALENDPHYHGSMTLEAVDEILSHYPIGSVVTYYNNEKKDIAFAFMSNDQLESRHLFVGEKNLESVKELLIDDQKLFILNPSEETKQTMQGNSYYQGEMSKSAVEALLNVYPKDIVITYFDTEQKSIILATKSADGIQIDDYLVGEHSFEELKQVLTDQGKLFLLNADGGDKAKMEGNPFYHGEMSVEEVVNRLAPDEVMVHYDKESKRVLLSHWDNRFFESIPLEIEVDFEKAKDQLAEKGKKLLSKQDVIDAEKKAHSDQELRGKLFHTELTQKKVNEYLNKFDKGVLVWRNPDTGKTLYSYKLDGMIKNVEKSSVSEDMPRLIGEKHVFLSPKDLNKIIPKTLPKAR